MYSTLGSGNLQFIPATEICGRLLKWEAQIWTSFDPL